MTIMYFSGISGPPEYQQLRDAGVTNFLTDVTDQRNLVGLLSTDRVVLDSGAYRAWKAGKVVVAKDYIEYYYRTRELIKYDFVIAPDVMFNEDATEGNWNRVRRLPSMIPVWGWGGSERVLKRYLCDRDLVGIGNLVPLMRAKDQATLDQLLELCNHYPNRFHLFGLNWLKAIELLVGQIYSFDTSKHLDGGRYGHLIFQNTKTGHLSAAPAKALGFTGDRRERIVACARNLREFVERGGVRL